MATSRKPQRAFVRSEGVELVFIVYLGFRRETDWEDGKAHQYSEVGVGIFLENGQAPKLLQNDGVKDELGTRHHEFPTGKGKRRRVPGNFAGSRRASQKDNQCFERPAARCTGVTGCRYARYHTVRNTKPWRG